MKGQQQLTQADVLELEAWLTVGHRLLEHLRTVAIPLPEGAEPPKDRRNHRLPSNRPVTVLCTTGCGTVLAVGRKGLVPRFCRRCSSRRHQNRRDERRRAKAAARRQEKLAPARPKVAKCLDCPAEIKLKPVGRIQLRCKQCAYRSYYKTWKANHGVSTMGRDGAKRGSGLPPALRESGTAIGQPRPSGMSRGRTPAPETPRPIVEPPSELKPGVHGRGPTVRRPVRRQGVTHSTPASVPASTSTERPATFPERPRRPVPPAPDFQPRAWPKAQDLPPACPLEEPRVDRHAEAEARVGAMLALAGDDMPRAELMKHLDEPLPPTPDDEA